MPSAYKTLSAILFALSALLCLGVLAPSARAAPLFVDPTVTGTISSYTVSGTGEVTEFDVTNVSGTTTITVVSGTQTQSTTIINAHTNQNNVVVTYRVVNEQNNLVKIKVT
jgi:hypothetical protein